MEVLVGCEESQEVTKAFRALGHQAFSCDLQDCSGGHPEWHLKMDVFDAIRIRKWDMGIFFPDCTFLTISANTWYREQPPRKSGKLVGSERIKAREKALRFVADLMNADIPRIGIENPIGVIGSRIFWYCGGIGPDRWEVFPRKLEHGGREPDQIIQPWMFGHGETKATCLWLKNLPKLLWSNSDNLFEKKTVVEGREQRVFKMNPSKDRSKLRSKTFPGIAKAMAEQWGKLNVKQKVA